MEPTRSTWSLPDGAIQNGRTATSQFGLRIKRSRNGSDTFNFTLKQEDTTQLFTWTQHSLAFESKTGSGGKRSESIHKWLYEPEEFMTRIPQNPEPVLMNLWLFRGKPPTDGKEIEIVVKRFKFTSER